MKGFRKEPWFLPDIFLSFDGGGMTRLLSRIFDRRQPNASSGAPSSGWAEARPRVSRSGAEAASERRIKSWKTLHSATGGKMS
jgi:hypothetical protein